MNEGVRVKILGKEVGGRSHARTTADAVDFDVLVVLLFGSEEGGKSSEDQRAERLARPSRGSWLHHVSCDTNGAAVLAVVVGSDCVACPRIGSENVVGDRWPSLPRSFPFVTQLFCLFVARHVCTHVYT